VSDQNLDWSDILSDQVFKITLHILSTSNSNRSFPVNSIYIWSKSFSHSAYEKSEANMHGSHWRPISIKVVNCFNTISPANSRLILTNHIRLLLRPSLCHGKVTISRGPAESCKMNKCCYKPPSFKKAVLFVQRWCRQQTLSLKNASFHVLGVAILLCKFHAAFL
jgi:hypothetical protein